MKANMRGLRRGEFACILADPPWTYNVRSKKGLGRSADRHYPTMKLEDIKAMPVAKLAAPDAHLFLWVTGPCLAQGFEVLNAWGFTYSALGFVWLKQNKRVSSRQLRLLPSYDSEFFFGQGHTTRQNAELVLLGRRGKPKRNSKSVRQVVIAPLREHSRKPDEVHERIEAYCDGPRLELFARAPRDGWTVWGNETAKFKGARS
jgi:N6-adenosine-specific RNA methylase IME4